jgi:hypothetical protein
MVGEESIDMPKRSSSPTNKLFYPQKEEEKMFDEAIKKKETRNQLCAEIHLGRVNSANNRSTVY